MARLARHPAQFELHGHAGASGAHGAHHRPRARSAIRSSPSASKAVRSPRSTASPRRSTAWWIRPAPKAPPCASSKSRSPPGSPRPRPKPKPASAGNSKPGATTIRSSNSSSPPVFLLREAMPLSSDLAQTVPHRPRSTRRPVRPPCPHRRMEPRQPCLARPVRQGPHRSSAGGHAPRTCPGGGGYNRFEMNRRQLLKTIPALAAAAGVPASAKTTAPHSHRHRRLFLPQAV